MEELGWETNMSSFPWNNTNHHQQETITFGSQNIFLNPIHSSPTTAATSRQIVPHIPLAPTSLDSVNLASNPGSDSCQMMSVNDLHEGNNIIPLTSTSLESRDCLRHEDGIALIFSNYNNLYNNISGVSSGDSVTKDIDDGTVSQCSAYYHNNPPRSKRPRSDPVINFQQSSESDETDSEVVAQMKEMIYRAAAFRPVSFADEELVVEKPRRRNVRISSDPQTVAARKRRERVSERIRVLQKLVPGGNKMDTASMLDEAANYLKFLRSQVKALEQIGMKCGTTSNAHSTIGVPFPIHYNIGCMKHLYFMQ